MPEGYQLCHKHQGHARNLVGTINTNGSGDASIFGFHYLVAPCAFGYCYKPEASFTGWSKKIQIFGEPTWKYGAHSGVFYGTNALMDGRLRHSKNVSV